MVGAHLANRGCRLEINLACWEAWKWPSSTVHSTLTYSLKVGTLIKSLL